MGFQGVWASRRGQTKAKQIKYYLKIQKNFEKTDALCCCYGNCLSAPWWGWRASVGGWISSCLLLPLINYGKQCSHKFSRSSMPWFCHFWLPFIYKAISHCFSSSFWQFWCQFYPKLSEIKPQYLWVLPPEGYGLGYCGCMGYEVLFPANQLGELKTLWDLRQYRVCEPWVMKKSTVDSFIGAHDTAWGLYFHSHSS